MGARIVMQSVLMAGASTLSACIDYPSEDKRFSQELVITAYDKKADFSSYGTFAIVPEVKVVNVDDAGAMASVDPAASSAIIERVASSLASRGYARVDRDASPDLGVGVTVVQGSGTGSVSGSYWAGYYASYWGYTDYGLYYPYAYTYEYGRGTLATQLFDLKNAPKPDAGTADAGTSNLTTVWTSAAYQAMPEENADLPKVLDTIDQAFLQSPYLHR